jgi:hypothetical protein
MIILDKHTFRTRILDTKQTFEHPKPTSNDISRILSYFGTNIEKCQQRLIFNKVKLTLESYLQEFAEISFTKEFGFEEFELEDILIYLLDDALFNLRLKKDRGKGVLYGHVHVVIRRRMVNDLPREIIVPTLKRKLAQHHISRKISTIFENIYNEENPSLEIENILDIGMVHSVYLLEVKAVKQNVYHKFVIKQEELPNQSFFCKLLDSLGWASYKTWHFVDPQGQWEISEYLGHDTLHDVAKENTIKDQQNFIMQLAKQAALGDVTGRGDRHFENYVINNKNLLPIDISFLFWEGNEEWTKKYIAAGMYEFNYFTKFMNDPETFKSSTETFFMFYQQTLQDLKNKESKIIKIIKQFFGTYSSSTARYIAYIQNQLSDIDTYFENIKKLYLEGFEEMKVRLVYKQKLLKLVENNEELVKKDNVLWMYYLADRDRFSCFFLIESFPNLFERIDKLYT